MTTRSHLWQKINVFKFMNCAKLPLESEVLDKEKLETAVCLEQVLNNCYKVLVNHIHNRGARKEFYRLADRALAHEQQMVRLLRHNRSSQENIEVKCEQYLANLDFAQMSLTGVLNLAIGVAAHTMDIYKYLGRTYPHYGGLLDRLVKDNMEEIDLLRSELEFHQQKAI